MAETAMSMEETTKVKPSSPRNLTKVIKRKDSGCQICTLLLAVLFLSSTLSTIHCFDISPPDVCHSKECLRIAAALKYTMDLRVDPCDDFYSYVCGNWADEHPRAEDRDTNSWYQERQTKILRNIRMVLERNVSLSDPKPVAQAKTMYQACLNRDVREEEGMKAIAKYLQEFGLPTLPTLLNHTQFGRRQIDKFDWIATVARIQRKLGLNVIIGLDFSNHFSEQNRNSIMLTHSGSLNWRYFPKYEWSKLHSKNCRSKMEETKSNDAEKVADDFLKIAEAINPGFNGTKYKKGFKTLGKKYVEFRNRLLKSQRDSPKRAKRARSGPRAVRKSSLFYTVQELQNITDAYIAPDEPYPIWQLYLDELFAPFPGAKPTTKDKLLILEENSLKKLVKLVSKQPLEVVELYIWGMVTTYITSHNYTKTGTEKDCANNVRSLMGAAVMHAFADKNFLTDTKPRMDRMLNEIREEFYRMVPETTWMDASTKHEALEKSKSMKSLIGFPEWILDVKELEEHYRGLQIQQNRYLENWVSAVELNLKNILKNWRIVNMEYWSRDLAEVNAFFNQLIPAATIQYPFYFLGLEALNYGSLGWILGHELTHGFDETGRIYDKFGNEKIWWSYHTLQEFDKRASCLRQQYSKYYHAEAGGYVNGNQTLAENFADSGGLREAFRAYRAYVARNGPEPMLPEFGEFSHEQLFFIAFANINCKIQSPVGVKDILKSHSPSRFRVKGVLSNMPEFSEAFQCAPGSTMNPEQKCQVW